MTSVRPARWSNPAAESASASDSKSPYTVGPAPETSARNAPALINSRESDDDARSFAGSLASSRGVLVATSASRRLSARSLEAVGSATLVECGVDLAGRLLRVAIGHDEHDPVVGRQLDRRELRAVAGRELRVDVQEERDVSTDPRCDAMELVGRAGRIQSGIGKLQGGRGVAAPTAESRGDRNPLLDPNTPARGDTSDVGKREKGFADDRVVGEPVDDQGVRRLDLDLVVEVDSLQHGDHFVLAVGP